MMPAVRLARLVLRVHHGDDAVCNARDDPAIVHAVRVRIETVDGVTGIHGVDQATAIDRVDFMDLVADRVELLHGIFLALTDRLRALLAVTEEGALAEEEYDDGPTNPV